MHDCTFGVHTCLEYGSARVIKLGFAMHIDVGIADISCHQRARLVGDLACHLQGLSVERLELMLSTNQLQLLTVTIVLHAEIHNRETTAIAPGRLRHQIT